MEDFSKEEISDLLYCLKLRKDQLVHSIKFFNEIIRDKSGKRLDILENCVGTYRNELSKIDLLILRLEKLL